VRSVYNGEELIAYTRAGNLVRNADGDLVLANSEGSILEPSINIPDNVPEDGIVISNNGIVSVRQEGSSELIEVGQIELARFVNPEGLLTIGKNLYIETDASGTPITGNPLEDGLGDLKQGFLEGSNVDPVRELVDLIFTQRGYELNSQSIKSADDALRVVTNLRT